jgi:hypothetical protein
MVGGFFVAMWTTFCRVGVLGLVVLSAGSCSLLVDADRQQCTVDTDCQVDPLNAGAVCMAGVCQPDPTWACLTRMVSTQPPETRPARITMQLRDLVTEQVLVGATARVCRKLDIDCAQPMASNLVGDSNGDLVVDTTIGFDGYVEVTARERMPGIYFFYPPVTGDRVIPNVPLIKAGDLLQFASVLGKGIQETRGHVMLGAYDCLGRPAEGVSLWSDDGDAQTTPFYSVGRLPSISASGTDASGRGGIINLKAGPVSITGRIAVGHVVGTVGLFVRPRAITYTSLFPGLR